MSASPARNVDRGLYFGSQYVRCLKDVGAATTIEQVITTCASFSLEAGAEHFAYRMFMPAFGKTLCLHNIDPEWVRVYLDNNYVKVDPRAGYCVQHTDPIRWRELTFSDDEIGQTASEMMKHASQFGFTDGISFPIHGVGSEAAMFSLSSAGSLPEYSELDIQTILAYANKVHSVVKRIQYKRNPESFELPVLSGREKECLKWTANGKTSWEIGQILGVSESTVVFHISKAVNKLGVSNRVQAVAKAMAQSQFQLY